MAKLEADRAAVKVEDGDYQVQVHVIECRDLKAEDLKGTSDPVVFVEIGGKKQNTAVHKETLGCVFDEVMFFNLPKATKSTLQKAVIKVMLCALIDCDV